MPDQYRRQITIRRARLADAGPVGLLTERVYRQGGWASDSYAPLLRDGRSRIEEAITLVAVMGGTATGSGRAGSGPATGPGTIVGTVTVALPGSRFAGVCQPDEIEVRMLAVAGEARGQGIGDRLMAACEAIASERGCTAVVLSTDPGMHAAHRLYRRRGYTRQPGRDWRVNQLRLLVFRLLLAGR
jgi:ribosomal protein S18 acetylase RimI-like enzyme